MLQALLNVFRVAELRNRVLFTLGMLAVFRLGQWVPLPGVNQDELRRIVQAQSGDSLFSTVASVVSIFAGGNLTQSTIFGLGVIPYISASIIFQLLMAVWPTMKKIQEEGPTGRQKIMAWTRYATIVVAVIQAVGYLQVSASQGVIYAAWASWPFWWIMAVTALVAGTVFLMWLGEQIDKHGIGNGVSMIIMAGILVQMPNAIGELLTLSPIRTFQVVTFFMGPPPQGFTPSIGILGVLLMVGGFVVVVGGSVLMTVAQRRIPVQQAKHTRGRKVFGGERSYLPLRLNHSGVMPVIFATSLMTFPVVLLGTLVSQVEASLPNSGFATFMSWLTGQLTYGEFLFVAGEIVLIYFFSYFWITVQFNPEDMSKQLRDHGSFIPGLRPGPRTAEYLETVMERITFVGAAFLAVIAVAPQVVALRLGVPQNVAAFLGGTGLLIVVSVVLDFMQRIEANLLMRNYAGFLSGDENPRSRAA